MLDKVNAEKIIDAAEFAFGGHNLIRYVNMFHWKQETAMHDAALAIEPFPRMESLNEHTWHVAYFAMLLAPYFPELNAKRVQELCMLHDILELITGDYNPTGVDGQGTGAHGFDNNAAAAKDAAECVALEEYLLQLPEPCRDQHRQILEEEMLGESAEARFVKVIDKMQSLIFIRAKKQGSTTDAALGFLLKYQEKTLPKFPDLKSVYDEAMNRLAVDMAAYRNCSIDDVWNQQQAIAA